MLLIAGEVKLQALLDSFESFMGRSAGKLEVHHEADLGFVGSKKSFDDRLHENRPTKGSSEHLQELDLCQNRHHRERAAS